MFAKESPTGWPEVTPPDLWFVYRTNPSISYWDSPEVTRRIAEFPYTVAFAYTLDETNYMADLLLPERIDIESTQLIRIGGTKFMEAFWDCEGVALRQPAIEPQGDTMDFTDIATELAKRVGILEGYNKSINRGAAGVRLSGENWDFSLDEETAYGAEEIWDRACKAASAELTDGEASDGLAWYKENGFRTRPISRLVWYLYPELVAQGLRFELPYQEQLTRVGRQLANRLHERGITWWDEQLKEYQPLPPWKDFPGIWERAAAGGAEGDASAYPFWLLTSRYMQYSWGANVGIQLMDEVSRNLRGHRGVVMNAGRAREMGISDGDRVRVTSHLRSTEGKVVLRQGIRPDTVLMLGQFDHWATPYAKDFDAPSLNTITPMALELTDSTGSSSDIVKVAIERVAGA